MLKEWCGVMTFDDPIFRNLAFITKYQEWRKSYHLTHLQQKEYIRNGKTVKGKRPIPVGVITINSEAKVLIAAINEAKRFLENGDRIMPNVEVYYSALKKETADRPMENFTKQEYNTFKDELNKIDPVLGLLLSFGVRTAIRFPGEFMNIKLKDIDFKGKKIYIRDRKNTRGVGFVDTAIPLSPSLIDILWKVINRPVIDKDNPNQQIWVYDNGHPMKWIHARWHRAMKAAKIYKHIYPYHMRAIGITRMMKLDIPIGVITYISGHTDDSAMIFKHYNAINRDDVQTAIFEVEEKLEEERKQRRKKGEQNIEKL